MKKSHSPIEAAGAEELAKNHVLKSHERELPDENLRLEHQLDTFRVGKESHEAQDVESTKAVNDLKAELAIVKEASCVL